MEGIVKLYARADSVGIEFGPALCASGAMGFFGEGYPYHRVMRALTLGAFSFDGCTLVAKTTTLHAREGNMPLQDDGISPAESFPKCIWFDHRKAVALNAVGLSGPGAETLFQMSRYQVMQAPFMLSFMAKADTAEARIEEARQFAHLVYEYFLGRSVYGTFGIQINVSCPNVGLNPSELVGEIDQLLTIVGKQLPSVPLMPKYNLLMPPELVAEIDQHPHCAGHCATNSIPWRAEGIDIDWESVYPYKISPLQRTVGQNGGLSGKPLFKPLCDWLVQCRDAGVEKPFNAGGGILHEHNVDTLWQLDAGVQSISVGSVAFLRPWRVRGIIRRAHELFGDALTRYME